MDWETARFIIGMFYRFRNYGNWDISFKKITKHFLQLFLAGGIGILYLSVTLAFQEYHLFLKYCLYISSIHYHFGSNYSFIFTNEVLIIFALIGGFASPLMVSNGNSNYLFLFIYISLLNLECWRFLYLKNWKSIGWFSFYQLFILKRLIS